MIVEIGSSLSKGMKLKIHSDERYLLKQDGVRPHPMLYPFWKHLAEDGAYSWMKFHEPYMQIAQDLFEMTSLEEADFAIMPDDWRTVVGEVWYANVNHEAKELYLQFAEKVQQAGKPLIIFFGSDRSDEAVCIENTYIFRHSYYRSRQQPKNFVWPSFCEDLVEHYLNGSLPIREKSNKPVIGFSGCIKSKSVTNQLKKLAYYGHMLLHHQRLGFPPIQGHILRSKLLALFEHSPLVATNFDVYDRMVFLTEKNMETRHKHRTEFVENIVNSDYVICPRGAGNYSNRLFETLCCGRIPILINTDCALPYDFALDWKKYCVWVEESEVSQIAKKVSQFHQRLSPEEFIELQQQCRKMWKEWLSSEGFYSKLHLHFQSYP
ncbi:exostosin family protein [Phormidium sp. FACHB-592]|uniref:Glycosyltransferase family 47 protein n=1 Tax=Stenomitos frigidus AS-A4 TaxID=2933935 RepID=A0ABV0KNZ4_9CYAN|nr:exostosin family protein [Phormidium sp. FACHB-592]MBD2072863.1 exostosin family protein [Phormidium sp. FACHB-592]